jgi:GMP synthase-like glutamine amidotransferase
MRFLVFQHVDIEHPGIFRDFFNADGIAWDVVELDAGEKIPSLDGYDALWVMGGPMDVWEADEYPWMKPEMAAIREAVAVRRMPFLGLCLGHQLLGEALGGKVGKAAQAEIGILDVDLTEEGKRDPLFAGLRDRFKALQWHGAEVAKLPPNAMVLASSPLCQVQGMRIGSHAYGLQYHIELTPETVTKWAAVPTYAASLDRALGTGALSRLEADAKANMAGFNLDSRTLYDNFMRLSGLRRRLVA